MARPLRILREDAWYHITARGNERQVIFRGDADRRRFLRWLEESIDLYGWHVHAYVLMPNHYHLLVHTPRPNLSRAMQWLQTSYSVWFNRRHRRVGHLGVHRGVGVHRVRALHSAFVIDACSPSGQAAVHGSGGGTPW